MGCPNVAAVEKSSKPDEPPQPPPLPPRRLPQASPPSPSFLYVSQSAASYLGDEERDSMALVRMSACGTAASGDSVASGGLPDAGHPDGGSVVLSAPQLHVVQEVDEEEKAASGSGTLVSYWLQHDMRAAGPAAADATAGEVQAERGATTSSGGGRATPVSQWLHEVASDSATASGHGMVSLSEPLPPPSPELHRHDISAKMMWDMETKQQGGAAGGYQ